MYRYFLSPNCEIGSPGTPQSIPATRDVLLKPPSQVSKAGFAPGYRQVGNVNYQVTLGFRSHFCAREHLAQLLTEHKNKTDRGDHRGNSGEFVIQAHAKEKLLFGVSNTSMCAMAQTPW